ncbi:FUSC family protein [Polynucleobacter sp. JS-Safj-400b-B2]|uniref:FUSC family protein n=1 Tax=Polynucleobacter sp. JS-Safj-400b-B2 TaxID=2576921 RepID=UPI001C0D6858|nr:FUSC family protein [Polynucleobacter sp. JS-Safj-400b-B2]MBU3625351.1 FUSC family protein [Polynucleobacter sp. JS-Safj-400b-B2]
MEFKMPSLNFKNRILQVVGLIVLSLLVAQVLQWDQGLWVAVSVTAIIGPFSASLTIEKSRNRIIGTIAGLLIATVLEIFLRYNNQLVFLVGIILAYVLGFAVQQNYRYFIMVVTVAICLNFEYMNLPFTSFEPISFLIARFMAVLAGITLFLFIQKYVYGVRNARVELVESTQKIAASISKNLFQLSTLAGVDQAMALKAESESFEELLSASGYGLGGPCNELRAANRINRVQQRVISLLLDLSYAQQEPVEMQAKIKSTIQRRALKLNNALSKFTQITSLNYRT